jgi:hypothetical protein
MQHLAAKSLNRTTYALQEGEKQLGRLSYKGWFSRKAEIIISPNESYQVIPHGFFFRTITIGNGIDIYLSIRFSNWGRMNFTMTRQGIEYRMAFRRKGIFSMDHILVNQNREQLMLLKPSFNWRRFTYEYDIEVSDLAKNYAAVPVMCLAALYVLIFLQKRRASAAS